MSEHLFCYMLYLLLINNEIKYRTKEKQFFEVSN